MTSEAPGETMHVHHRLQARLLEAYDALLVAISPDRLAAGEALARLLDFTAAHFAEEERVMATRGYPDRERHQATHRALLEELRALEREAPLERAARARADAARFRTRLEAHVAELDGALDAWLGPR